MSRTTPPTAALGPPLVAVLAALLLATAPVFAAEEGGPGEVASSPLEGAAPPPAETAPCWQRVDELAELGRPVELAIATLPDPLESGFAREFDLFLAAVRRSLEGLGMLQDRHCLPWASGEVDEEAGRADAQPEEALHRREPGVVVFRGTGGARVLLVVGERPASGIHREAMLTALDRLAGSDGSAVLRLRILGPTFSGGADSLGDAVAEWLHARAPSLAAERAAIEVRFVSGTATGTRVGEILEQSLAPAVAWSGPPTASVSYAATGADNDALRRALWGCFVPERLGIRTCGEDPERGAVALLQESSLYGREFEDQGFLVFPFPMNISQLATRWERQRRERGGRDENGETAAALELDLARAAGSPGAVASFDPQRTTASMDLVLSNILATIARKRVRIVAIAATSTEDKIFLAERISRHVPNVRLVTFEGDILLAHPRVQRATHGMVVVSSNPLLQPLSAWSGEPAEGEASSLHLHFATDGAQGIFRAAQRLFAGEEEEEEEHQQPQPDDAKGEEAGRRTPAGGERAGASPAIACDCDDWAGGPEVWISVVGRGGLHPLRRYPKHGLEPLSFSPPRAWRFLWWVATVGLLAALAWGGDRLRRGRDVLGVGSAALVAGRPGWLDTSFVERRRLALLTLTGVFLAGLYLMWSVPVVHPGALLVGSPTSLGALALLAALLFATAWTVVSLAFRGWAALRRGGGPTPARWRWLEELAPVVLGAGAVAAVAWLVRFVFFRDGEPGFGLFLVRAQSLAGGVNPLPPTVLLLAVPLLWLAMNLGRYRALRSLPHPAWTGERRPGRWARRIRDSIAPGVFSFQPVALLLFVPAAYLTWYYAGAWSPRVLWGMEHRVFDLAASVLFFAGVALAIGSLIGSWRGWRALRRLLDWLPSLQVRLPGGERGRSWLDRIAAVYKPALGPSATVEENRRRRFGELLAAVGAEPAGAERLGLAHLAGAEPGEEEMARAWSALARHLARGAAGHAEAGEPAEGGLVAAAHGFFAWQTAHLVRTALGQLLQILVFMTVALLLLLAAITLYPFQPQSVLAASVGSLILIGAAAAVVLVLDVERNPILSQLTGTPAGLTWHRSLVARFGLFAGLPLVSLLASRFPWLREQVGGWLGPLLQMLR